MTRAPTMRARFDPATKRFRVVDAKGGEVLEHPINRFLDSLIIRALSPATVRAYAFDLVSLHRWLDVTGKKIDQLTEALLLDFVAHQQAEDAKPRSINRRLVVARSFYEFETGREMPRGIGASTHGPHYRGRGRERSLGLHARQRLRHLRLRVKPPRTLVEPLTVEQVRAFLRTVKRYRDLAIVYLLLLCGLRSEEVLRMEIDDICVDDRHLRVHGKGNKERVVPLPKALTRAMLGYLRLERPPACPTRRVFVVLQGPRLGHPMTPAGLRSLFRHRRRAPNISRANAHRFRHTFGADMARAGVRLPALQKLLGHADVSTTMGYIALSLADLDEEYQRAMKRMHRRYEK